MEEIKFIKTEGWHGVFVNSETPPYKSTPLNHYTYTKLGNEIKFSQLFEHDYLYDEIMVYSVLRWESISVKSHCETALKQMIDSLKSVKEFKY